MALMSRDEEFSAFVAARRTELVRSACLLTAGDQHMAEDLVQTALAKLYMAWPREHVVPELPDQPDPAAQAAFPDDGAVFPDGVDGATVRAALAALPRGM